MFMSLFQFYRDSFTIRSLFVPENASAFPASHALERHDRNCYYVRQMTVMSMHDRDARPGVTSAAGRTVRHRRTESRTLACNLTIWDCSAACFPRT